MTRTTRFRSDAPPAGRSPSARRRAAGFTLIEMVVVLVVAGVIMAVVAPALGRLLRSGDVREPTRRIAAVMRFARTLALADKQPRTVVFDRRGGRVAIAETRRPGEADLIREIRLGDDVWLDELDAPGLDALAPEERDDMRLICSPLGTFSPGSAVVRNRDHGVRITPDSVTGDIAFEEVEFHDDGRPPRRGF